MFRSRRWAILFALTMIVFLVSATLTPVLASAPAEEEAEGKPPEVISLDMLPEESSEVLALREAIEAEIEALSDRMIEMNDWLYENPETGYQEFESAKMLASELEKHGFEVTFGVEGLEEGYNDVIEARFDARDLPTAFIAKYKGKSEHPVIGFNFETDALRRGPDPFHGCQHNQQGPAAVGAAIALSKVVEENDLPGSVWVVHTPAEEIPPPDKSAMVKAGVLDEVDVIIRSHGTPHLATRSKGGIGNCCMLIAAVLYDFSGKPAHGAFNPWDGQDALDAARLFFTAVDMLREHSKPDFRLMGTITEVGAAPNVVNDYVQVDHWIRNADRAGQGALNEKVAQLDTIAEGVAMATFTDVEIRQYASYYNGIEYAWLQALAWYYTNEYGDAEAISEELGDPSGWDEGGYGSVSVPGVSIQAAVANRPETPGHSDENAAVTITPEGHKGLVQTATIGAVVGLRLMLEPELLAKVVEEQAQWQEWALKEGLITEDMIRE